MKVSEAVLVTGILSSVCMSIGLLTSAMLADASAGGFAVAATADAAGPWFPDDVAAAARGYEAPR